MLTGISGSYTAQSASMIAGRSDNAATGSWEDMALLRAHGLRLLVERGVQRVPGEARALHARGELADAAEDGQLAERRLDLLVDTARHHPVELLEQLPGLGHRLPLHRVGHEGRRRPGDGAPRALERDG